MEESRLNLKMVDGNVEISTYEKVNMDGIILRGANIGVRKYQMEKQLEMMDQELERIKTGIEQIGKNKIQTQDSIDKISKDITQIEQFLKSNHQEQIIGKIETEKKRIIEEMYPQKQEQGE